MIHKSKNSSIKLRECYFGTRTQKTVCILMLIFFIMSVTVTGCLSSPPSVKKEFTDIAYATKSETQKLDIYLPNEGKCPFPVITAFHGGGFFEGNKSKEYTVPMFHGLNQG